MRKRKRRRSKKQRHAWWWVPVLAGTMLLVGVFGALFARDVLTVRDSLLATQASLSEVMTAAGEAEVDEAAAELETADAELAVARSRSQGPLWSLAQRLPVVGADVEVTRATVELASASVAIAETAIGQGEGLVADGLDVEVEEGRLDLAPLQQAGELIDQLPVERFAEARDRLAALEPSALAPDELGAGRTQALELADRALGTIETGEALLTALPSFLGTEEPRRYFLGVQTPGELRGTGGMIGYWAVLEVADGTFSLDRSDVYDVADDLDDPTTGRIGQLSGDITQGAVVDEEFRERYEHVSASGLFSNVNVDPDLPTTAEVALDLFEQRTGDELDGVLLIDPVGLQAVLEAVGADLEVPEEAVAEGAPETVAAEDFAEFALVDVYEEFGQGRGAERKLLLRGLGDAAFARVFNGAWDGVAVSQAVAEAAGGKHLQVYSRDEAEQTAFERLGAAGRLATPDDADLLAVTANNAVGGKQDVHVAHLVSARLELADPRRDDQGEAHLARRADVTVEVDNPLPERGLDTYIIGSCTPTSGGSGCFDGPPGLNRTWFSVWAPQSAALASSGDGVVGTGRIRDLTVFDRFLETPSRERNGFELGYEGRVPATETDDALVYELQWWGQAKAVPTRIDVTVTPPDGWRVDDLEVVDVQADVPTVFGSDEELTVQAAQDGSARVTGTLRGDATVRAHLVGE